MTTNLFTTVVSAIKEYYNNKPKTKTSSSYRQYERCKPSSRLEVRTFFASKRDDFDVYEDNEAQELHSSRYINEPVEDPEDAKAQDFYW